MPCSDDGRLLGSIRERGCEGDVGSDCWSDTICSASNGEETELGLQSGRCSSQMYWCDRFTCRTRFRPPRR